MCCHDRRVLDAKTSDAFDNIKPASQNFGGIPPDQQEAVKSLSTKLWGDWELLPCNRGRFLFQSLKDMPVNEPALLAEAVRMLTCPVCAEAFSYTDNVKAKMPYIGFQAEGRCDASISASVGEVGAFVSASGGFMVDTPEHRKRRNAAVFCTAGHVDSSWWAAARFPATTSHTQEWTLHPECFDGFQPSGQIEQNAKVTIRNAASIPTDLQSLFAGSRQFVQMESTLRLLLSLCCGIQFFMKMLIGRTVTLDVDASAVDTVIATIQETVSIPPDLQPHLRR